MITENPLPYQHLHHRLLAGSPPRRLMFRYSRPVMFTVLVLADALSLIVAASLSLFIWDFINPVLEPSRYVILLPIIFIFFLSNALAGLYPGIGISPADEFRRVTISTSIAFLSIGTLSFYFRNMLEWSRGAFAVAWFLAIFIVPNFRQLARTLASRSRLWGEPVAIIGSGPTSRRIQKNLNNTPELGLKPYVAIHGKQDGGNSSSSTGRRKEYSKLGAVQTAIIVTDEISPEFRENLMDNHYLSFARTIVVSNDLQSEPFALYTYDLAGIVGLGKHINLLSSWQQWIKRLTDLFFILLLSPLILPTLLVLSLAVQLDSPGPIFFRQNRIGKGGRLIPVWKFRTMVIDAETVLEDFLAENPNLREEWEQNYKLKQDPRVTRAGNFLRRTSLDELPQVINVVLGQMSLVGPRPIIPEETKLYGKSIDLYKLVSPGLTGIWQVSGRNNLTYRERVELDERYVRNWSIWLDFFILQRTIGAVISGRGAY